MFVAQREGLAVERVIGVERAGNVLRLAGLDEPIGCTANHPIWSETKQEFVRADALRPGEAVLVDRLRGTNEAISLVAIVDDRVVGHILFTPVQIEGAAPTNSLFVDDGGRVGLGTSTPVLDLHVVSGNTPALRLEQDGSSGFTAQTWDVAGNEAVFFVRDVTAGSRLPFKIVPGAPTNSLVTASSGDVGVGILSPRRRCTCCAATRPPSC
ncbi:MAG: hypothetical protein HC794_08170 [Nitrospiraceae bacterium]|nr:hypothetical protein [Nitrospiraceae bacterium]